MGIIRAASLNEAISALSGSPLHLVRKEPVYGGDINQACRLTLSDGTVLFRKSNSVRNLPFFEAEARGLDALRRPGVIGVPTPLAIGTDPQEGISFLLLNVLESAPRIPKYWEVFGHELAALHRWDCSELMEPGTPFGFPESNFAGSTPQKNTPSSDWIAFFRDCRLRPMFLLTEDYYDHTLRKQCDRLLEQLDCFLPKPEFPSLLHGDLWGGNSLCGPDGKAWILDPATYIGHFEVDLAMTELFGGYPGSFYAAYQEVNPIEPGYRERRDLYNLYHLLNHLHLFGSSYYSSVRRIVHRYAGS